MKISIHSLFIALALLSGIHQVAAQGTTAFTYQGQLRDGGTNANGAYTMTFKLWDAVGGGNQIGNTITHSPTLANGLFTVNLDFGAGAFNGNTRWLDIAVQDGTNAPENLVPRVQVLPAPYALYAATAGNVQATNVLGVFTVNVALKQGVAGATSWDISVANFLVSSNGDKWANDALIFSAGGMPKLVIGTNGSRVVGSFSATGNIDTGGNFRAHGTDLPLPQMQVFDTSGTFVVPTNVTKIMVEVWGGGGAGADQGSILDVSGIGLGIFPGGAGGGGGGGGYGKEIINVTQGDNMVVTVGSGGSGVGTNGVGVAGGASSIGSVSATGGEGGHSGGSAYARTVLAVTYYFHGNDGTGGNPGASTAVMKVSGGGGGPGGVGGIGGNGGAGASPGGAPAVCPGGGGGGGLPGASGRVVVWW